MNLDLDTLREMISSTLQEITTESLENTGAEESAEKAAELAADTRKEKSELAAAKKDAAEEERQDKLSPEPPAPSMVPESFEITKGRLKKIIAEELFAAKKQGIL